MAVSTNLPYTVETVAGDTGNTIELALPANTLAIRIQTSDADWTLVDSDGGEFPITADIPIEVQDRNLGGKTIGFKGSDNKSLYVLIWTGLGG